MSNKTGGSAFPQMSYEPAGERPGHFTTGGLTFRDYFAGWALLGIRGRELGTTPGTMAKEAYAIADAMLAERSKCEVCGEPEPNHNVVYHYAKELK